MRNLTPEDTPARGSLKYQRGHSVYGHFDHNRTGGIARVHRPRSIVSDRTRCVEPHNRHFHCVIQSAGNLIRGTLAVAATQLTALSEFGLKSDDNKTRIR
jgi:hypothetical protein